MWKFVVCILLIGMIMIVPTIVFAQEEGIEIGMDLFHFIVENLKPSRVKLGLFIPSNNIWESPFITIGFGDSMPIPLINLEVLGGWNLYTSQVNGTDYELGMDVDFNGLYYLTSKKDFAIGAGLGYYILSLLTPDISYSDAEVGFQILARYSLANLFLEAKTILAGVASGVSLGLGWKF